MGEPTRSTIKSKGSNMTAITNDLPVSSAQKAMQTLTAQWYNAVVTGCELDRSTFQLMQGNVALGATSESLWNVFDAVPPLAVSALYNPSQANLFSQNYGAVINNLIPQDSGNFVRHMGDYLAPWQQYVSGVTSLPSGGLIALFRNWADVHMPPGQAQQCYTDWQQVAQGVVPTAVQMWLDASGNRQKAYNQSINALTTGLQTAKGCSFSMDSTTQNADVSNTWARGSVGGSYDFFSGQADASWDQATLSIATAGVHVTASFDSLLTFAAGPLAHESVDPTVGGYRPWYYEPALSLAFNEDDNIVWSHTPPTWDGTFGATGSLQRVTSALVVVDGVEITVKSSASFNTSQQQKIEAQASAGIWPFFQASGAGGWSSSVTFDDTGAFAVTSQSARGNPQVLGAIVTPIASALG